MLILDQIRPYLQPLEYLEAIQVVITNSIEKHEAKTAEIAFYILWSFDRKGNWVSRYKNALRVERITNSVNQTNQLPQAATGNTCEAGQTKTV